jgi:hypothetical protein
MYKNHLRETQKFPNCFNNDLKIRKHTCVSLFKSLSVPKRANIWKNGNKKLLSNVCSKNLGSSGLMLAFVSVDV